MGEIVPFVVSDMLRTASRPETLATVRLNAKQIMRSRRECATADIAAWRLKTPTIQHVVLRRAFQNTSVKRPVRIVCAVGKHGTEKAYHESGLNTHHQNSIIAFVQNSVPRNTVNLNAAERRDVGAESRLGKADVRYVKIAEAFPPIGQC
jgi:hypothetical protein